MNITVPDESVVATAAVEACARSDRPIGDGEKPDPPATGEITPYAIVYAGASTDVSGSLAAANEDGTSVVQISSFAHTAQGALWMQKMCRRFVLDRNELAIEGRVVIFTSLEGGRPLRRDTDIGDPPMFSAVDIFHIRTSSSA